MVIASAVIKALFQSCMEYIKKDEPSSTKQMNERDIQADIRLLSRGDVRLFRQNVGRGWVGKDVKLPNGDVLIRNARRFHAGFPGLSDVGGWVSVVVTPEMVGQRVALYAGVEVKSSRGQLREAQDAFIRTVLAAGGRAGRARSVAEACAILGVDPPSDER